MTMTRIDTTTPRSKRRHPRPGVVALVLSALLLAACEREDATATTTAPTPPANAPAPLQPASSDPPATAATIATTTSATPTATFEFVFSSQSTEEAKDPRIQSWEDSPCGMGPRAKVDHMPIDDPVLLPDWVVEFDATGRERKRWGKPYEAEIIGLEGNLLKFRVHGHAQAYWTDPEGRIGTLAGDTQAFPELQTAPLDCPTLPTFETSAYLFCWTVVDEAQRKRTLAWEGPCT
jgi:hypothetical protein